MTFDYADCHPLFGWIAVYKDRHWAGWTFKNIPVTYFGA